MGTTRPGKIGLPAGSRPRRPGVLIRPSSASLNPIRICKKALGLRLPEFLAWSNDGERIVARGHSFDAARQAARAEGEPDPIVERTPTQGRRA